MRAKIRNVFIIVIFIFLLHKSQFLVDIRLYKRFINVCKKLIYLYNEEENINNSPFFSICITVYNMENHIEISLLSVLNQSYRNFEIIIINDFSQDTSKKIIQNVQSQNSKIRLFNHEENLGIYKSRIDAIRNAKGNYIIFLDSDDLFSNPNLLKELYKFNLPYNNDMIEFTTLIQEENHILYYSFDHRINHFHNFEAEIVFQPYLSNILFFEYNNYSDVFCRCLWNKMVRKDIYIKTINFLGNKAYEKKHFDLAEDTIINILNFEFASNYSNINLIGYIYNIRKESISHINEGKGNNLKIAHCMLYFYKLFFRYIKYFNKDLNYLYFDLRAFDYYLKYIKQYSSHSFEKEPVINFYKMILKEKKISSDFKIYIKRFISDFIEEPT